MLPMSVSGVQWQDYKHPPPDIERATHARSALTSKTHCSACGGTKSRIFFQAVFRGCRMIFCWWFIARKTGGHFSDIRWQSEEVRYRGKADLTVATADVESDRSGHCTFLPIRRVTARSKQRVLNKSSPSTSPEAQRSSRRIQDISGVCANICVASSLGSVECGGTPP